MKCCFSFFGAACIAVALVRCNDDAGRDRTVSGTAAPADVTKPVDTNQTTDTTPEVDETPATSMPNSK